MTGARTAKPVMKKRHKGLHAHRLKREPDEKDFANAWAKHDTEGNTLAYLLGDGVSAVRCSERDYLVAATLMQWLGSEVGKYFLASLGYERHPKTEVRDVACAIMDKHHRAMKKSK